MRQLTKNVYIETEQRGSNHGIVTTSDGIVLVDGPHKPSDTLRLKADIERRGPLRYILNTEPHGDHWTSNAYFDVPVVAHEGVRARILGTNMAEMVARVGTFGPDEPKLLEGYRANAPVITFTDEMRLHVGDTTFRMVSMPGHTPYQAAVVIEEEGCRLHQRQHLLQGPHVAAGGRPRAVAARARLAPRARAGDAGPRPRAGLRHAVPH